MDGHNNQVNRMRWPSLFVDTRESSSIAFRVPLRRDIVGEQYRDIKTKD